MVNVFKIFFLFVGTNRRPDFICKTGEGIFQLDGKTKITKKDLFSGAILEELGSGKKYKFVGDPKNFGDRNKINLWEDNWEELEELDEDEKL